MLVRIGLLLSLLLALFIIYRKRAVLRSICRVALGGMAVLLCGCVWFALEWFDRPHPARDSNLMQNDLAASETPPSESCLECHKSRHASWYHSFHRTMTREATPEYVKADFNNAFYQYLGVTSRMYRSGDHFFIETADPDWIVQMDRRGIPPDRRGLAPRREFSVDRLVGSHWFQQMMHRDEQGRYIRLPLVYHLVEKRWIHQNGAFLAPESPRFFSNIAVWNETCLFCHNTGPNKRPVPVVDGPRGYRTEVSELGISCEACHGPGERHILAHKNMDSDTRPIQAIGADPTIINPSRLSVKRSDDICAHCHGVGLRPQPGMWDPDTHADPFQPGQELTKSHYLYWSDADLMLSVQGKNAAPAGPKPIDGRFWGDGTPLTTAHEYQGMALSKCYQGGEGKMSCLSCHSMHGNDPNHQLKEGMRTNAACYACHDDYRKKLVEHTHHGADSAGSLCANCHMPYQVYSLLDTHRSHRIAIPRVRDSLGTGKPHACNLCHLDKSLGWTGDQLRKWYGTKPEPLSDDERTIASSLLHLTRGDARTRAVVAGAFGWPPAQKSSGRDWQGLLLTRIMAEERYPAVRYLAHRALRSLHGDLAREYDYLATPSQRAAEIRAMEKWLHAAPRPDGKRYPYLPLTGEGLFLKDELDRLLRARNDPDLVVHE